MHGLRRKSALVALIGLAFGLAPASAQEDPAPPAWQSFLWMYNGPPVDERLFRALRATGVTGTNVAGTASSGAHGEHGVPFYVDHAAGKGWLTLKKDAWRKSRDAYVVQGDPKALHRPACLSDPATIEAILKRMDQVVAKARPHGPVAYALDDEIALSGHGSPFDYCHSPATLAGFRAFLQRRYDTIERLRVAWGSDWKAFNDIVPPTTHDIRRRELLRDVSRWNLTPWSDFREYMASVMTRTIDRLADEVRARDPEAVVGFTGGAAPSPFSGIEWPAVLPHVGFAEPYDVGGSRELVRSFARPGTIIYRTIFRDEFDSRLNQHEMWDYMLRGDRGVILWSAENWFSRRDPGRPTVWAKALAPTMKALQSRAVAEFLAADPVRPQIAILESEPSNRLHWMLDTRVMGRNWIHRLASAEITESSQNRTREAWQKLLEDLHFDYEHITPSQLTRTGLAAYKVLILPRTIALSRRHADAIARFAEKHTVIADCQVGLFDERLRAHPEPPLDAVFGITRKNRRVNLDGVRYSGPADPDHPHLRLAEPGLGTRPGTPSMMTIGSVPVMLIKKLSDDGPGRAVYLNLLLTDYLEERTRAIRGEHPLCEELRGLIRAAGVPSIAEVRFPGGGSIPVRLHIRRKGETTWLGIIANWRTSTVPFRSAAMLRLEEPKIEILLHRARLVSDAFDSDSKPRRRSVIRPGKNLPLFRALLYRLD